MAASRFGLLIKKALTQTTINTLKIDSRNYKRWLAPTLRELQRRKDSLKEEKPNPRNKFLEWNLDAEIFAFGKRLGESFNYDLLKQALTHQSYVNPNETLEASEVIEETQVPQLHNEELIKAGQEIIDERIKDYLRTKYPEMFVQPILAYLTSEENLAHVGSHLGLTDLILTEEFPVEAANICKTLKAVIAALEQSSGLEKANKFIDDFILTKLNDLDVFDIWEPQEPFKYLTQELLSDKKVEPRLCNQSASNTILANFQVGLYNEKKELLGIGWGESVDIAKNTAALDAIRKIYRI